MHRGDLSQTGPGTHSSLHFSSLLWDPGQVTGPLWSSFSPLLVGGDDAYLTGLWGESTEMKDAEVFVDCKVLCGS